MKKMVFLVCLVIFLMPFGASAVDSGWEIADFSTELKVLPDGRLQVYEIIEANFFGNKHGIFRYIPHEYKRQDGSSLRMRVALEDVRMDGSEEDYSESSDSGNVVWKIGKEDVLITGRHTYQIRYLVEGALSSFDNYDEIYWNVTGNGWEIPISRASARVFLNGPEILQYSCYRGFYGSTDICDTSNQLGLDSAEFRADQLGPKEGLTLAVGFKKGMVPIISIEPTLLEGVHDLFSVLPGWLVFLLALIASWGPFSILIFRSWFMHGRDYWWKGGRSEVNGEEIMPLGAKDTITPEYSAPLNLRPAQLEFLIEEDVSHLSLSATIVDLAIRGYLRIEEIKKEGIFGRDDYRLVLVKDDLEDLVPYERKIIDNVFKNGNKELLLSEYKANSFENIILKLKEFILEDLQGRQIFVKNSKYKGLVYFLIPFTIGFFLILGGEVIMRVNQLLFAGLFVGAMASVVSAIFYLRFMHQRTAYGHELYRQAKGYKLFLSQTERYRQQFFERENIFMEVLPFAMVFGVTDKLVKAMKSMGMPEAVSGATGWYVGAKAFNVSDFESSMSSFATSFDSAMAPSGSGSGGGGSSGGGGGGGGGGSW